MRTQRARMQRLWLRSGMRSQEAKWIQICVENKMQDFHGAIEKAKGGVIVGVGLSISIPRLWTGDGGA